MLIFTHICKTYCPLPWLPLFFLVVHMYPVWWCLRDTLVPLDSTYASPRPPKMKTKIWKIIHQITSIFCILLSFGVILRCLWALKHIYIMFLWVLLTNVYWFRATGGYICGCGRPSNLVISATNNYDFYASFTIISKLVIGKIVHIHKCCFFKTLVVPCFQSIKIIKYKNYICVLCMKYI